MTADSYPRLRKLLNKSNMPNDIGEFLESVDKKKMSENVWEYYDSSDTNGIRPLSYRIYSDDEEYVSRSLLGVYQDGGSPTFDKIESEKRYFSEYEDSVLESVSLEKDKHWNGDIADARYKDGDVLIGKTDYYSTAPIIRMLLAEIGSDGATPLRDDLLGDISDFESPQRPLPASSGGVMLVNTGDDNWALLIGRRSEKTHINSGLYSMFPNGKAEYPDLKEGFEKTVEREFKEEIFDQHNKGEMFYRKNVDTRPIISGWNLRSGGYTVGHALIIDSRVSYDVLDELSDHNEEVDEIVEVPVSDASMIAETASLGSMSGAVIATIFETLRMFDVSDQYPDLPYDIDRITE